MGGIVHTYLARRYGAERPLSPLTALVTMRVAEALQMIIILLVARPFPDALQLVEAIAFPMIAANSLGAAIFMSILRDRRDLYDQVGAASTARALRIAGRTLGPLAKGFTPEVAPEPGSAPAPTRSRPCARGRPCGPRWCSWTSTCPRWTASSSWGCLIRT